MGVSYLTADAIAYPLALAAFCALIALLDRPSRWLQMLMPILCAGATLARVQYVVLPVVFVVAALVLERGRIVAAARRYPLTLVIFVAPVVLIGAAGPGEDPRLLLRRHRSRSRRGVPCAAGC